MHTPIILFGLLSLCNAHSLRDLSNRDEEGPPSTAPGVRKRRMMSEEDQKVVDYYMDKLNKLADEKHPEV
ncbi:hypothetical protein B9Z55_010347 [Caenorhabditis nigoni]|uniref:Uncharacterized protein n=1 Tax=Caenorhabditis nigoni TaxID=1611254 RepID=A0A2G5UFL1_9PELO|nr:hypothetical protein B9Z55_010347 [Caenorhabditis nigoni]